MKKLILVFVLMQMLGCAATKRLSDEDKQGINAVYIDSYVVKTPFMYYSGPDDREIFGTVSDINSKKYDVFLGDALKIFMSQHNIYIEKIVEQEMRKAFEESRRFPIVKNKDSANAFIKLFVSNYGFRYTTGFNADVVPIMSITCKMYNAQNKLIWMTDYPLHPDLLEPVSVYDMKANPEIISNTWRNSAKYLAAKILLDLDLSSDKEVGQDSLY